MTGLFPYMATVAFDLTEFKKGMLYRRAKFVIFSILINDTKKCTFCKNTPPARYFSTSGKNFKKPPKTFVWIS